MRSIKDIHRIRNMRVRFSAIRGEGVATNLMLEKWGERASEQGSRGRGRGSRFFEQIGGGDWGKGGEGAVQGEECLTEPTAHRNPLSMAVRTTILNI